MKEQIQNYIQQLDTTIKKYLKQKREQHQKNKYLQEQPHKIKFNIYNQFFTQLKKLNHNKDINCQFISQIKTQLQQHLFNNIEQNQIKLNKRGRPRKYHYQQYLIQWIKLSGKAKFYKKEINKIYCQFLGKKRRSIPTRKLINILQKNQLSNIQIITKVEGKEKKKRKINNITVKELKQNKKEVPKQLQDTQKELILIQKSQQSQYNEKYLKLYQNESEYNSLNKQFNIDVSENNFFKEFDISNQTDQFQQFYF